MELLVLLVIAPSPAEPMQIHLVGEFDCASNPPLALVLRRAVEADVSGVVTEMSKVTFLDCSTVRVLARAAQRLEARGGRLVVARPSRTAGLVLDVTGYAGFWPVTADLTQAVHLAQASAGGAPPNRQQPDPQC